MLDLDAPPRPGSSGRVELRAAQLPELASLERYFFTSSAGGVYVKRAWRRDDRTLRVGLERIAARTLNALEHRDFACFGANVVGNQQCDCGVQRVLPEARACQIDRSIEI